MAMTFVNKAGFYKAYLAIAAFSLSASGSAAVTIHTDSFITSPTAFNGFENIESSPNFTSPYYFNEAATYTEGGISVHYNSLMNDPWNTPGQGIWTKSIYYEGKDSWYRNGGGWGYTTITQADGKAFDQVQFLAASGKYDWTSLLYQIVYKGVVIDSGFAGSVVPLNGDHNLHYFGFSGTEFDEVRLKANGSSEFIPGEFETLVVDSISLHSVSGAPQGPGASAVPEPASWAMMIAGFGLVGGTLRKQGKQAKHQRVSFT